MNFNGRNKAIQTQTQTQAGGRGKKRNYIYKRGRYQLIRKGGKGEGGKDGWVFEMMGLAIFSLFLYTHTYIPL